MTETIRIIGNLFWDQTAKVYVDDKLSIKLKIQRGFHQGCILSSQGKAPREAVTRDVYFPLQLLFRENLPGCSTDGIHQGIVINGVIVRNIRNADNTVSLANSLSGFLT